MNCSDLLIHFLVDNGIDSIFGIPGYANSPILFSTLGFPSLKPVLTRHEANAAWMAYGYAQISGKFGVCTGTSGAGTTNILSAVSAAYYNSIPILVLTGQVETNKFGKGAFQELTGSGPRSVDVMKLFANAAKMSRFIATPEELPDALGDALEAMTSGRPGPVHLNIPVDVLKSPGPGLWTERTMPPRRQPAQEALAALEDLLGMAKAPLFLFGRGCRRSRLEVAELISRAGVPFCTTLQGRGVAPEDDENYLGVIGVAGAPRCNSYVDRACDLIVAVGTSLGEFTTNGYATAFCRSQRLVHVDIDPREFGKSVAPRLTIEADATAFCEALANSCGARPPAAAGAWRRRLDEFGTQRVTVDRVFDDSPKIAPMDVIAIVEKAAPDDAIIVADSGNNAVWTAHYLSLSPHQDFLIDINTGCMGSGVVSAIGAKLAAPHRAVIAICGDGGFMMNGVDVATAADLELAIIWVVMNDFKLGMVDQGYRGKYGATVACDFRNADVAAMARAYGADAEVIWNGEALSAAMARLPNLKRPLVLDVRVNDLYLPAVYARVKATAEDLRFADAAVAKNVTREAP